MSFRLCNGSQIRFAHNTDVTFVLCVTLILLKVQSSTKGCIYSVSLSACPDHVSIRVAVGRVHSGLDADVLERPVLWSVLEPSHSNVLFWTTRGGTGARESLCERP